MAGEAALAVGVALLGQHDLIDQPAPSDDSPGSQGTATEQIRRCKALSSDMKSHTAKTWYCMNCAQGRRPARDPRTADVPTAIAAGEAIRQVEGLPCERAHGKRGRVASKAVERVDPADHLVQLVIG